MEPQTKCIKATHYEVLGITPTIIDSHHDPSALLKRAYRRALLQNHPDKTPGPSNATTQKTLFTIDQITEAFNVLSSSRDRSAYDKSLRAALADAGRRLEFQTGVEDVDLDDIPCDEKTSSWYRSCRCGNDRAYSFTEEDLTACEDEGELMVGCQDCSLWLRVSFAVVEDMA